MTKITQADIDAAYLAGKMAYRRDFGAHGPTLRPNITMTTFNPHPRGSVLAVSWDRGYAQDVRRVIAPAEISTGGIAVGNEFPNGYER